MIHENSISPESAIQGTRSLARRYRRGALGKTQLNMDKVNGGSKMQIK